MGWGVVVVAWLDLYGVVRRNFEAGDLCLVGEH